MRLCTTVRWFSDAVHRARGNSLRQVDEVLWKAVGALGRCRLFDYGILSKHRISVKVLRIFKCKIENGSIILP